VNTSTTIVIDENTIEVPCYICSEPLLIQTGDRVDFFADETGLNPICSVCANKVQRIQIKQLDRMLAATTERPWWVKWLPEFILLALAIVVALVLH